MQRSYYSNSIANFLKSSADEVIGKLATNNEFDLVETQKFAWLEQIQILKRVLPGYEGGIFFEYSIPRMGQRIDALLIIGPAIFVLEFKVGEKTYDKASIEQVWDYALDLKNFHETSHKPLIAPILIPTEAPDTIPVVAATPNDDNLLFPIKCNEKRLRATIDTVLKFASGDPTIDLALWKDGRYKPTPTIIEAALALYNRHTVEDISRTDAGAANLSRTSGAIEKLVISSRDQGNKSICFVTGVPGAGKTLVGLNVATRSEKESKDLLSVYLSGNGPLVNILREALTRDQVKRMKAVGTKIRKKDAFSKVKAFVQNVHNFRDEGLKDEKNPPPEHVVIFDEAQRAWDLAQTANFMKRKRARPDFDQSESEFLISCMNRHKDWAVIVCLVGEGQEINTGEAGIAEWLRSLKKSFRDWDIYASPHLLEKNYESSEVLQSIQAIKTVKFDKDLHLAVSMRAFRAEHVSKLITQILDLEADEAKKTLQQVSSRYPIVLTRDITKAKKWLRNQARGSERYGMVVSSSAERLKPHAIDVKSPMDPVHWFLDPREDVRSSYFLEDVATEFHVQGLELDWTCVTWDADMRYTGEGWDPWAFRGHRWNRVHKEDRKKYLKNAYRVLLTRARQGMVIVVPEGDKDDQTRNIDFYDPTYEYLRTIGLSEI